MLKDPFPRQGKKFSLCRNRALNKLCKIKVETPSPVLRDGVKRFMFVNAVLDIKFTIMMWKTRISPQSLAKKCNYFEKN